MYKRLTEHGKLTIYEMMGLVFNFRCSNLVA